MKVYVYPPFHGPPIATYKVIDFHVVPASLRKNGAYLEWTRNGEPITSPDDWLFDGDMIFDAIPSAIVPVDIIHLHQKRSTIRVAVVAGTRALRERLKPLPVRNMIEKNQIVPFKPKRKPAGEASSERTPLESPAVSPSPGGSAFLSLHDENDDI